MTGLHLVVLAAGRGTRMKSSLPKVLHRAAGFTLIGHVLRTASHLTPASLIVVLGHQAEEVRLALEGYPDLQFCTQEPQLGTGHALLQAESALAGASGTVVLLSGDVPRLRAETIRALVAHHQQTGAAATVLTAIVADPHGYGRVIREQGEIAAIVEHKDAGPEQRAITEVNSGIYAFDLALLFDALRQVGATNVQREYYLPDLVAIFRARQLVVETVQVTDPEEVLGINSQRELASVAAALRAEKNDALMAAGVTMVDPAATYIDLDVTVGADTVIHPNSCLEGATAIGSGCEIQSGVRIVDSTLDDHVTVNSFCLIARSIVRRGARIGPFAHIRPDSEVGEEAHIGNFVELKKTRVGRKAKANHLAYLGDAIVGAGVNIGAGVITCNYDGTAKHQTIIEDEAFVGSDSQLVAPVRVGQGAYVAAGSTITHDVPAGSLAIARGRQVNKEGWRDRRKGKP